MQPVMLLPRDMLLLPSLHECIGLRAYNFVLWDSFRGFYSPVVKDVYCLHKY